MKEVSELEGAELDYWVAKAKGLSPRIREDEPMVGKCCIIDISTGFDNSPLVDVPYMPSQYWHDGGPLIQEWDVLLFRHADIWVADCGFNGPEAGGSTPLEAVCHAIVALVYGDYVPENENED